MMKITRLYPLHRQNDNLPDKQRHIGETVFDSSLHPAAVALLQSLHQSAKPQHERSSWGQRIMQWYSRIHQ